MEDLLSDQAKRAPSPLPGDFAVSVVGRAREVKLALLRHRRWLLASFLLGILLATFVSLHIRKQSEASPPPFSPLSGRPLVSPPALSP